MKHWLMKSEPEAYSWNDLCRDKVGTWDGVRNYQARNNLRAMKKGDLCLFYHSVSEKAIVGICRVIEEHFPDETAKEGDWSCVRVEPVEVFTAPITLADIKADTAIADIALLKQSRLSVCPISPAEFSHLRKLGKTRKVT
jgi:predicted RNA-binding protein with PUA-like domain